MQLKRFTGMAFCKLRADRRDHRKNMAVNYLTSRHLNRHAENLLDVRRNRAMAGNKPDIQEQSESSKKNEKQVVGSTLSVPCHYGSVGNQVHRFGQFWLLRPVY